MAYYIPYNNDSSGYYLQHGLFSALKGTARKVHKYIMRVAKKNGRGYDYFYTQAQVDAYNKNKDDVTDSSKKEQKVDAVTGADKPATEEEKKAAEKKGFKYILKVATMNGWRYFYDQKEVDAYRKALSEAHGKSIEDVTKEMLEDTVESSRPHSREKKVGEGSVTAEKGEKVGSDAPVGGTDIGLQRKADEAVSQLISNYKEAVAATEKKKKEAATIKNTYEKATKDYQSALKRYGKNSPITQSMFTRMNGASKAYDQTKKESWLLQDLTKEQLEAYQYGRWVYDNYFNK